jgi:hypothetical protein
MIRYAIRHKVSKKYFAQDEGGAYLTGQIYHLMDETSADSFLEDSEDDYFYDESTGNEIPFSDLEKVKLNIQEV